MDTLVTGTKPQAVGIAWARLRAQYTEEDTGDLVLGKPDFEHVRGMRAKESRYALHNVKRVLEAHRKECGKLYPVRGLPLAEIAASTLHRQSTVSAALHTLRDMEQVRYVRGEGWVLK